MKRILPIVFTIFLLFSISGCAKSTPAPDATSDITTDEGSVATTVTEQTEQASATDSQQTSGQQTEETGETAITTTAEGASPVTYENTRYGFTFSLPESWSGYTIITDKWKGVASDGQDGEKTVETGPMISIRHPEWTSQDPRQDIPIMIFTIAQWDALQKDEFHIGAAPIGPGELDRNSKYVFALPARYNYAFPTGYEEVEKILEGHPLQPK